MEELLNQYYELFPNEELIPRWLNISEETKEKMLKESIQTKKVYSKTKIFRKLLKDFRHEQQRLKNEIDFGNPVGNEIW